MVTDSILFTLIAVPCKPLNASDDDVTLADEPISNPKTVSKQTTVFIMGSLHRFILEKYFVSPRMPTSRRWMPASMGYL